MTNIYYCRDCRKTWSDTKKDDCPYCYSVRVRKITIAKNEIWNKKIKAQCEETK